MFIPCKNLVPNLRTKMATLESVAISFFHHSYSSNPPLISPSRSKLSFPISTQKSYPLNLSISRKFQVFSSAAIQDEILGEKTEEKSEQKRLFVLNLPWTFTVDELKNLFTECGTVQDAEIIKRKKDGKSRGYAFVTMASTEEALSAIGKYDSHELMGRIIRVEFAKDSKKTSPPPSPPGEKRYKLYVSNLAWRVRSNNLKEFFATEFKPLSTRVVFESPEGRSAGYGFVTFATKEEAESAITALNGKELLGRAVTLAFSERNADKSETEKEETSIEQADES